VEREPVLCAAHLSRDAVRNLERRIPFASVRLLWEAAAGAAGDPAFGVHVAESLAFGSNDVFDYLAAASATLGEALTRLCQYLRILYDRSNLPLVPEPLPARLVRRVSVPATQYEEFLLSWLLLRTRQTTGVEWVPEKMAFQHERPAGEAVLASVFRC